MKSDISARTLWMRLLAGVILTCCFAGAVQARPVDGDWSGKLKLGPGRSLELVLHISGSDISMDSPDQNAYGLKCETYHISEDSVSLGIPSLMMSYAGKLEGATLRGTFRQGGLKMPLSFKAGVTKRKRPQTPQPPFPYPTEEVKIDNPAANSVLAGTLSIPKDYSASTPVVVFVSGSGPSNRDEELFEHKPFAVIADYLARNGVASLRYDDRGVGESTGDRTAATTADFASDAKVVVDWLRAQKRFSKTGVVGHSEGGMIAYMLGAAADAPDFVVSIAGPAVDGTQILDYQNKTVFMNNGMTEAQAAERARAARKRLETDPSMTWMHYFLRYDPAGDLQNLHVPAFIIYGEKDCQVPPSLNFDTAKRLAPEALVKCYPQLNHLMQHAKTGAVEEYNSIEETFSPELLADILAFIKQNADK